MPAIGPKDKLLYEYDENNIVLFGEETLVRGCISGGRRLVRLSSNDLSRIEICKNVDAAMIAVQSETNYLGKQDLASEASIRGQHQRPASGSGIEIRHRNLASEH